MRTRKLTCPLTNHRIQLQKEYFEKSVKKSLPKWLNRLEKWNIESAVSTEQILTRVLKNSYQEDNQKCEEKNTGQEKIHNIDKTKIDKLMESSA